jgi:serine/threonine protein kinase
LSLVGEGQFGKVYTATHRQTGELLALKEFNPQKFSTKKFLREMRILLSLEHPNIILGLIFGYLVHGDFFVPIN